MWYVVFGRKAGLKVPKIHDHFTDPSGVLVNVYGSVRQTG